MNLSLLLLGIVLGLVHGVLPDADDRLITGPCCLRPAAFGSHPRTWYRRVRRYAHRVGPLRTACAPGVLLVLVLAGSARLGAVLARLADLGAERGATVLAAWTDPDHH
ncbi:hypothetical protein [Parafrankia discariae]|uniref:hypothetical protein n=1 Tax=Parafrankia discariae TaxID=365528 RepID=UPI0003691D1C|nr:hypothetical protein [Parafrankia discariae]